VNELTAEQYSVAWDIVDCSKFGIPQNRRMLVLVASRLGTIDMPKPQKRQPKTVRSAIGKLPLLKAGDQSKTDPLHAARSLTPMNLSRIRASSAAGTWRDWPEELRVACHYAGNGRYPSVYGRMSWDKPSPTITTQFYGFGNGRFGHPEQDRALTLREGAILQSFPADFVFVEKKSPLSFNRIGKLIGNAVPPSLARAIGKHLVAHVDHTSR
jgi:DNA (cytosine-5)-methyltransferase 1